LRGVGQARRLRGVLRLVAVFASFSLSAQAALPLALACCSAPASHECCARAGNERSGDLQLGSAPCCRSESTAATARKEDALSATNARASPIPAALAIPSKVLVVERLLIVARSNSNSRVVRALGPPLLLRI